MKTNDVHNVLRVEAAGWFVVSLAAFWATSGPWSWFAILFFVPDLGMLGYLRGSRWGAVIYNATHSYTVPLLLASLHTAVTLAMPSPLWLVWFAHIAFDRALGYGLKFDSGFHDTHLGLLKTQKASAWIR